MRILILVPALDLMGGVANYFRVLRRHFLVETVYFTRGSRGRREARFADVARLARDYVRFVRVLFADGGVDLVQVNTSLARRGLARDAIFILLAKFARRPVVVFFRGWDSSVERDRRRPGIALPLRVFLLADRAIVLASEFRTVLRGWGFSGEVVLESTAVDDALVEGSEDAGDVSDGNRPFTTLFLARVERRKGIYVTLQAHQLVLKRHPDAVLLVAGDGSELEDAKRFVAEQRISNVEFLGYVRDCAKRVTFLRADCYVLPTTHAEGLPNSLLEAMAFGLPVIVRPVGGVRDVVTDGLHGFVTEAIDAPTFASLIERLIVEPDARRKMSERNRTYARERFLASAIARRLEGIYARTLGLMLPSADEDSSAPLLTGLPPD